MPHPSSPRVIFITLVLIALAGITVVANWGSGFGFSRFATVEAAANQGDFSAETALQQSEPRPVTTPLNAITTFDAALISRYVVQLPPAFSADQLTVSRVAGQSFPSSLDSSFVAKYVVNLPNTGSTGTIVPPGLLMGNVSGAGPHYDGSPGTPAVSLPDINAGSGGFIVPISVGDVTGLGIVSFEFQVTFDPSVVQMASPSIDRTGTLVGQTQTWSIVTNFSNPGHMIVAGWSWQELAGSGTLIKLRFNVVGSPGQSTALTFENYTDPGSRAHQSFLFNEGTPSVSTTNGYVTLVVTTPTATKTPTPTSTATNTATATPTIDPNLIVPVSIPHVTGSQGSVITIPIMSGDVTGRGVTSYDAQITYDPAVLQPVSPTCDVAGTMSVGMVNVNCTTNTPGHLIIGAFQNLPPMTGSGTLLNIRFTVLAPPGQSTPLTLEDWLQNGKFQHPAFVYNEGDPPVSLTSGSFTVTGGTPTATPSATATPTATPTASPTPGAVPVPISLPHVNAAQGSVITIPITTGQLGGLGVNLYELQVTFDPAVLELASPVFDRTETLSSNVFMFANPNHSPGHLILQGSSNGGVLTGSGTLVNLRFSVVGTSGQSTALTFEAYTDPLNVLHPGFIFGEDSPTNTTTNGSVTIADMAIAGNVTYGNAPATRFVPDVRLSGAGSVTGSAMTGLADGVYLLSGFGTGAYTVTPSKTGSVNGAISSYDAARIAQHVAGTVLLTGNQLIVADVSGNGTPSSFDAGKIARFVAAVPDFGTTGNWIFNPVSRSYPSIASIISGENYSALLMGEVSGNWVAVGPRPLGRVESGESRVESEDGSGQWAVGSGPVKTIAVGLPQIAASTNKEIVVPVSVKGAATSSKLHSMR